MKAISDRRERLSKIKWIMMGRLVLISALLGVGPFVLGLSSTPFFFIIGIFYSATVVYGLLLKTSLSLRVQAYGQFMMDSVIITAILSFTGGIDSNFVLLYVLTIFFSSTVIGGEGGLMIAVCCSAMYSALGVVQCFGLISRGVHSSFMLSGDPFYVAYIVVARATIFCVLGYLGDFLVNSLNRNRLELEELKKLNEKILSQIKSGLITTDAFGKIIFVNSAAEQITGYRRDEMLGKSWQLFLGRPVQDIDGRWLAEEARSFTRCEIPVRRKDGAEVLVGFTVSSLLDSDGSALGLLILFRDLTQVHRMEERMRKADRLSAAGSILASVAHEVRTPLSAIRGAVEVLGETLRVGKDQQRLMNVILKESDRLNRIVSDFIRYNDSRQGSRTREDMGRIIDEVVALITQGRKITGDVTFVREEGDGPVYARVDAYQIKQVMINILNNALDALHGRGTVSVGIARDRSGRDGKPRARIRFADTGEGMSTERMEHLFDPFFSTKESGTGMGLFIAERIVRSHGGQLEVESREGGGTVFTITLPSDDIPEKR